MTESGTSPDAPVSKRRKERLLREERLLVIVPAYNEAGNVRQVTAEIHESLPEADILVVNDDSADGTGRIAREDDFVMVADLPCNLGVGGAVQTGFMYAAGAGYDLAVQIDGDGQHMPSEVEKLLETMRGSGCDVVIGSRFHTDHGGSVPRESFRSTRARRVGIRLFSLLLRLLAGIRITDATSGFRLYNRKSLKFLAVHYPDDYPEPEAIVLLRRNGFSIREVPVAMRERMHGKSSITPFKSVYYMLKVVLCIFLAGIRRRCVRRA